jgi:cytochrome c oxidase subunit 3
MNVAITKQQVQTRNKIHPLLFATILGCVSITMMFMAWTSAYIVRQAAGNWLEFRLPTIFFLNTAILFTSSLTLHGSYLFFKRKKEQLYKGLLVVSLLLALTFLALQYLGWQQLFDMGVALDGNPAGSFVYVLSGFHALHIFAGVAVLIVALVHAFALRFNPVSPKRKLRFKLTLVIWHFLDFLWLYILTFIILQS